MNYICAYYDTKEEKWYHSKPVKKREAEHLMRELLNIFNQDLSEVYIFKIVRGEKVCDRNSIH